jgi:ubiquinol-cytochrome c reductase iron-sulfur subunit
LFVGCFLFLKQGCCIVSDENALPENTHTRRDFLYVATAAFGAVGVAGVAWPIINQMNPDQSVLALSSTEVDLSAIQEGQTVTIKWRGKPVFIRHRTGEELKDVNAVDIKQLRDPEEDSKRVLAGKEKWLVVLGNCTHLGCVPVSNSGDYKGWYCPCHGSHYDASGRIRRGPAPKNLVVPQYQFLSDTKIRIG